MENKITPIVFSLAEACAALGVCERTLHRWAEAGHIKLVRMCGSWKIATAEIERLVRDGVPSYVPTPEHRKKMRANAAKASAVRKARRQVRP